MYFSYSIGTSTTVLSKHMLHAHGIEVKTERETIKQKKLTDIFITVNTKKTPLSQSTSQIKDERFILGRRLTLWMCKDLLPFKMVDNKGFNDFWASLNNDLALPTRQTISVSGIDDMYSCMKKELIVRLENSGGM